MGSDGEGYDPTNSWKNEQDRSHMVAKEKRVHLRFTFCIIITLLIHYQTNIISNCYEMTILETGDELVGLQLKNSRAENVHVGLIRKKDSKAANGLDHVMSPTSSCHRPRHVIRSRHVTYLVMSPTSSVVVRLLRDFGRLFCLNLYF